MRDLFVSRLVELFAHDENAMLITGDLGFGVLDELASRYGDRLINAGVAEQNMVGMAAGLALEGFRPFVYSIGNFPTLRAIEQLRNDVCYHRLPVRVISVGGGLGYGPLGVSHHATDDLGVLLAIPGLDVFTPSTRAQTLAAADAAFRSDGPVYIRIDRGSPVENAPEARAKIGKATTLRVGFDLTVLSYGALVAEAVAAADELAGQGISVQVEALTSLRPLDEACLHAAIRRGPVVTVEEHVRHGGLASLFAQLCLEHRTLPIASASLHLGDQFVRAVGSTAYLRTVYGIDRTAIVDAAREALLDVASRQPAAVRSV